jgi:hypothetical protein
VLLEASSTHVLEFRVSVAARERGIADVARTRIMAARNPFASSIPDIYDAYAPHRYGRQPMSTGYYFLRNLLVVVAVVGGFVALYRNDVLRELAKRVGQEQRYLAAEKSLVGIPGWGTPRSMEPVLVLEGAAAETAATPVVAAAPAPEAPPSPPATSAPAEAAPVTAPSVAAGTTPPATEPATPPTPVAVAAPAPSPPPRAAVPVDPLAPVSLESLPLLGANGRPVSFGDLPATTSRAVAAPAPRAAAPVAARPAPAPAARSNGKAIKVSLEETPTSGRSIPAPSRAARVPEPEPAPAPVAAKPAPPPSGPKTTDVHKNDNPLMAAVRGAVRARPAKGTVPAAE